MYRKSILPNGIRVVSETIPYVKSVTLGIWVGTGSCNEQDYNHGISHFIEHLMFKGTERRTAKEIAESVDAVGGQLNAFTAKEYTCYYIKVIDSQLDFAVDLLSDMLNASKFDPEDIAKEREVVLEEVKMYEDSPDELVHDIHLNNIWPEHPLGRNILGTVSSISQFDQKLVKEYCQDFYCPDNIVIAAAGNLTHQELLDLSNRYFGHIAGKKKILSPTVPLYNSIRNVYSKETEQVHLCISSPSVRQDAPEVYPIHVLNNIFGGGISSRLFQSIREERGLAYSVYSYQTNYSNAGLFTIYAGTRPANSSQVIELILADIKSLKTTGVSKDELARAKEQLKGSLLLGLESSSSRMSRIGKMEVTLGKYVTLDEVVEKINRVSYDDVHDMINNLFIAANLSVTALGPVNQNIIPKEFNI